MSEVLQMSSSKLARIHRQTDRYTRSLLESGPPTKNYCDCTFLGKNICIEVVLNSYWIFNWFVWININSFHENDWPKPPNQLLSANNLTNDTAKWQFIRQHKTNSNFSNLSRKIVHCDKFRRLWRNFKLPDLFFK